MNQCSMRESNAHARRARRLKLRVAASFTNGAWCSPRESDPHAFRHSVLSGAWLPFHQESIRGRDRGRTCPRSYPHWHLKPACLPNPPRARGTEDRSRTCTSRRTPRSERGASARVPPPRRSVRPGDRTLRVVLVEHVCSPAHSSHAIVLGGTTESRTRPTRLSGAFGLPVHLVPWSTVRESNPRLRLIRPATVPTAGGWYWPRDSNPAAPPCKGELVTRRVGQRGGRRRGSRTRQRVFPKHVAHPGPCLRWSTFLRAIEVPLGLFENHRSFDAETSADAAQVNDRRLRSSVFESRE